jgi:hypothetical protein
MLQPSRFPKDHVLRVPHGINNFNKEKAICIHSRNLPHWRQDGATYFVTFRQFDSIPRDVWEQMKREVLQWNRRVEQAIKAEGRLPVPIAENWEAFQRSHWIKSDEPPTNATARAYSPILPCGRSWLMHCSSSKA